MPNQAARRCATCCCDLSRFNDTPLCGPWSRCPQLPAADDLWTTQPARLALNRWDVGAAVALDRRYTVPSRPGLPQSSASTNPKSAAWSAVRL